MLKNRKLLGILLSIIMVLAFSMGSYASYYKYTQESGANFYVGTGDKSDALEDTNQVRQILDDLGNLLGHSKRNDSYPADGTTGGTLSIFGNYYLKTAINTQSKMETIWGVTLATDAELAALTYSDVGAIQDSTDTVKDTHIDWGTGANQISTDDVTEGSTNKYFPGFTSLLTDYAFTDNSTNWNTAFGWGDHSTEGYLKAITGESIGDLSDVDLTDIADGKILKYNSTTSKFECEDESGGGASTFLDLTDTPANYTGQAGTFVKVNTTEDALEFGTPAGGGNVSTSGTPVQYDYARFVNGTDIEGRSYSEAKTDLDVDDLENVANALDSAGIVTGGVVTTGTTAGMFKVTAITEA